MKSLVKVRKLFAYTLAVTGELTFFYGLLAHGSTVGLICELVGLSAMIAATFMIASEVD